MIRSLIGRVFGKKSPRPDTPEVAGPERHCIRPDQISVCAKKVVSELQRAGFKAFIVGGAVRDLLMGMAPKDYDVATDATPEQVHALFRRSHIIGRRFRLVNVICGRETVEVSTFRGFNAASADESSADESGRILRDNTFGSQREDAMRRDFALNALYYDPTKGEIWDYQHGLADLKAGVLRMIGDPEKRYREDPVRLLRAVRLSAKLDLTLEPATRAPIGPLAGLLNQVPPSRLFDEMLKLFFSGHAYESTRRLREEGLHHGVLPLLDVVLEQPLGEKFVSLALQNTDSRIREGKPVSAGFLFACLLWHEVLATWEKTRADMPAIPALNNAMEQVIQTQIDKLAIPRRFCASIKEIWGMQPRFLRRSGGAPFRLLSHPRFRSGYDFLILRCQSGELPDELGAWWDTFQDADEATRRSMSAADDGQPKKKRRSRRRRSAAREGTVPTTPDPASPASGD